MPYIVELDVELNYMSKYTALLFIVKNMYVLCWI